MNLKKFKEQVLSSKIIDDKRQYFFEISNNASIEGDVVEMGVFNGESLRILEEVFPNDNIFGFDSFEGIPEEWVTSDTYTVPKNFFNLGGSSPDVNKATLVKGWFSESLPGYKENINQIKFLHIDSDLYSSAILTLEEFNDHIKKGTLIAFDEFIQFPEAKSKWYPNWEDGEYKACIEWMEKYNRKIKAICRTSQEQCCFVVEQ